MKTILKRMKRLGRDSGKYGEIGRDKERQGETKIAVSSRNVSKIFEKYL